MPILYSLYIYRGIIFRIIIIGVPMSAEHPKAEKNIRSFTKHPNRYKQFSVYRLQLFVGYVFVILGYCIFYKTDVNREIYTI